MCRIPGLLEDSDAAQLERAGENQTEVDIRSLQARIVNVLRELFLWRWWWEQENPSCAYLLPGNHPGTTAVDENSNPLFQSLVYFQDYQRGREPILCDASLLLMLQLAALWEIHDAPKQALAALAHLDPPDHTNSLILPHEDLSITEVVHEILTSIEFFLQGDHKNSGALTLMLPLRIVFPFAKEDRVQRWLTKIASSMATYGFRFSHRLHNLSSIALDLKGNNIG